MTRDQARLIVDTIRASVAAVLDQRLAFRESLGHGDLPARLTFLPEDLPALADEIAKNAAQCVIGVLEEEGL